MEMMSTMPMAPAGYGNFGGLGAGNDWFAFLIIAMLFGWGGNGFGFGGRGMSPASTFNSGELVADQFALQDIKNNQRHIDSGIRGLERGLCTVGYDVASQASQTRESIGQTAFGLERGLWNLSSELSSC